MNRPQPTAYVTALLALALLGAGTSHAQEPVSPCGPLRPPGQFGPFDYRKDLDRLPVVMNHHFTPPVEALIRGQEGSLGGDIDYTLRAFPNHARALVAMVNLGVKEKTMQPRGANYTVECYFERAIRFASDDAVVRMIYVTFLTTQARAQEARAQLESVESLAGDNPFTYYNLGLLYLELKDYDKALAHAHTARQMGVRQTTLQDKLTQAGRWREPAAEAAASAPAADSK